jgi:RHS repeat-associated protein
LSRPGSVSANASYDGYARLAGYARTDVGTLSFAYNGQDDRVAMTSGTGTRRFVYDTDGRVLGEYGASASDVKAEFIWALPQLENDNEFGGDDGVGGYAPLAVATPDSGGTIQLNWVHGNHLGVPIVTTDASGNAATTPNDYLAPGFPGQSRTLADLYYNRYRDYDPTTGRYIQADPIGLEGGGNSYLYAEANPIRFTDPLGLQTSFDHNLDRDVRDLVEHRISEKEYHDRQGARGIGAAAGAGIVITAIAIPEIIAVCAETLGPRGAIFGARAAGRATAGILNRGKLRIGFSRHKGDFRFSIRYKDRHFDLW